MEALITKITWFDIVFVIFVGYFLLMTEDFISSFLDLLSFIVTLLLSYKLYAFVGPLLVEYLSLSRGIANATGFFLTWFFIESILFLFARFIHLYIPLHIKDHTLNKMLAYIPSLIQGTIFYLLITVTIFSLPTNAVIKEEILRSATGPYFISFSHTLDTQVKRVFGQAANETINFMTIRNTLGEGVNLGFKAPSEKLTIDSFSENTMLSLINRERESRGLNALAMSSALQDVARDYATDMFIEGFFSHESPVDGSDPADRIDSREIPYTVTGENLAYAPDVYIAHQGLMNSPGHRANILNEEYLKVGIGVIDGGIYGKMFVQEFSD